MKTYTSYHLEEIPTKAGKCEKIESRKHSRKKVSLRGLLSMPQFDKSWKTSRKRKYSLVTLIVDTEKTYVLSIGYTLRCSVNIFAEYIKKECRLRFKDEEVLKKALEKSRDTENEEEQIYIAKKIEEDSKG